LKELIRHGQRWKWRIRPRMGNEAPSMLRDPVT
jgi:hypothetical protein